MTEGEYKRCKGYYSRANEIWNEIQTLEKAKADMEVFRRKMVDTPFSSVNYLKKIGIKMIPDGCSESVECVPEVPWFTKPTDNNTCGKEMLNALVDTYISQLDKELKCARLYFDKL